MATLPKNVVREIIKGNKFENPGEIYGYMKEMFKDVLQEMLEAEMVSRITERIMPEIKEWQSRPLEAVYPFIFMDAILSKAFDKIAYSKFDFIESAS